MVLHTPIKRSGLYLPAQLPLSWATAHVAAPQLNIVRLPLSGLAWVPTAEIPVGYSFEQVYEQWLKPLPYGFVLQFCGPHISSYLVQAGGQAVQIGLEGLLPVQSPAPFKASVLALARRGHRWGRVIEADAGAENRDKLARLAASTPYAGRPQLFLAFRTGFDAYSRCFAFVTPAGHWLAAITLSSLGAACVHTELLLRRQNAPVGVMEALLTAVYPLLSADGVQQWSLGGVPFAVQADVLAGNLAVTTAQAQPAKTALLAAIGRSMRFAYNYKGLFNFKDKFSPRWRPLYLCGYPGLPWRALLDLAVKMRYARLAGYQIATAIAGRSGLPLISESGAGTPTCRWG